MRRPSACSIAFLALLAAVLFWEALKRGDVDSSTLLPNETYYDKDDPPSQDDFLNGHNLTIVTAASTDDWCQLEAFLFHVGPVLRSKFPAYRPPLPEPGVPRQFGRIRVVVYDAGLDTDERWHLDWYKSKGYLDEVVTLQKQEAEWWKRTRTHSLRPGSMATVISQEANKSMTRIGISDRKPWKRVRPFVEPNGDRPAHSIQYILWAKPGTLLSAKFLTHVPILLQRRAIWAQKASYLQDTKLLPSWANLGLEIQTMGDQLVVKFLAEAAQHDPALSNLAGQSLALCDDAVALFQLPDAYPAVAAFLDLTRSRADDQPASYSASQIYRDAVLFSASVTSKSSDNAEALRNCDAGSADLLYHVRQTDRRNCSSVVERWEKSGLR